jgi:tetratricopeptide (TPR) repeat protein
MDTAERVFIESLIQTHRSHLQVLEQQSATFGVMAPPYVVTQIADYRQKIAELEGQLRPRSSRNTEGLRHNLPPREYEQFIGRQKELTDLRRLLQPYPKSRAYIITIDGIGGIGKSALVLESAYTFVDQYNDLPESERFEAIIWVSAKRTYLTASGIRERRQVFRTIEDVFAAIARVLNYPAITRAKAEDQRTLVEDILREQRTLLILDNLETVDDEDLLAFLHELPDPTKALVTTRHRIDVARPVRLTGMPHEDALALISQESARKGVALSTENQEELWQRTGGVPLAIVWSVGLMGLGGSAESVLRRLGSGQSDIARFCFEESITQIRGRDAYWILQALSLFVTDANRDALGVVAGLAGDEFGRDTGLEDLLRLSLVNKESDRFSLLPLTRSYVRELASQDPVWLAQANDRWRQYFVELVDSLVKAHTKSEEQQKIERELANIISVVDDFYLRLRYRKTDTGGEEIELDSKPIAKQLITMLTTVARVCRVRGHWNQWESLSRSVIDLSRKIGDTKSVATQAFNLSRLHYYRHDYQTSKEWAIRARDESLKIGFTRIYCQSQRRIGLVALHENKLSDAEQLISAALEQARSIQEEDTIAPFLAGMGHLAGKKGDLSEAARWYQEAIEISRHRDETEALAVDLLHLGRVRLALGYSSEANVHFLESLRLAQEDGTVDVTAQALFLLASLEAQQYSLDHSVEHAKEALDLFRRLGMKHEQAEVEALLAQLPHLGDAD